jgi:hypothetical protein
VVDYNGAQRGQQEESGHGGATAVMRLRGRGGGAGDADCAAEHDAAMHWRRQRAGRVNWRCCVKGEGWGTAEARDVDIVVVPASSTFEGGVSWAAGRLAHGTSTRCARLIADGRSCTQRPRCSPQAALCACNGAPMAALAMCGWWRAGTVARAGKVGHAGCGLAT